DPLRLTELERVLFLGLRPVADLIQQLAGDSPSTAKALAWRSFRAPANGTFSVGKERSMKSLKKGDVVMIVRWPHEHGRNMVGRIGTVEGFGSCSHCTDCEYVTSGPVAALDIPSQVWLGRCVSIPIPWLRKIQSLPDAERDEDAKETSLEER